MSNRDESLAGTDPWQSRSVPLLFPAVGATWWPSVAGKQYQLQTITDLATGTWHTVSTLTGNALVLSHAWPSSSQAVYRRLLIQDLDSDGDQLTDWEEAQLGLNPRATNSERFELNDRQWAQAGFTNTNTVVTCSLVDGLMYERWPDPGVVALRRTGSLMGVMPAERVADRIVRAIERREREVYITLKDRVFVLAANAAPGLFEWAMRVMRARRLKV